MKIYLGTDHNGFQLRNAVLEHLKKTGYEAVDEGDNELDKDDDYPLFAGRVISKMLSSDDSDPRGILLCGSGQGMCMAANRFKGIRAALGYDRESVRSSRNDDDANVLCLPADRLKKEEALELVDTFLTTEFAAAQRFNRRIEEMDQLN